MNEKTRLNAVVHGRVQGVFFRAWTLDQASHLGISGFVRNLQTGQDVEVEAEGDREQLEKLLSLLRSGPPGAEVNKISTAWSKYTGIYPRFNIHY
jgi:acylphosphatase